MPDPIAELTRCLARLPGLGRRSASRAALALLREPDRLLAPLAQALKDAKEGVVQCPECGAFATAGAGSCRICADPMRDGSVLCVVEDPADVVTIEASGAFNGRYHVLGGKLSPARRSGSEKLRFAELKNRIGAGGVKEVLLAVSTDMDGDATAAYVAEMLSSAGAPVRVTRLAFGLPADSGVAYSDPLTLRRAIANRLDA